LNRRKTHKEFNPPIPPAEYITIKQQDFDKRGFHSTHPPPTKVSSSLQDEMS